MKTEGRIRTADIIIVGAGVMGASLAFQLTQRNAAWPSSTRIMWGAGQAAAPRR
jgi:glycine/D-amino acid oxidase-like deaminating enzyme